MPDHDHDQTARDREMLEIVGKLPLNLRSYHQSGGEPFSAIPGKWAMRLLTLATEALELREEVGRAHEQIKVLTRGFNAAHEMQDEAIAALREENARLARELGGAGSGILPAPQWQTHLEEENATLRQENARLDRELEQAREDAEVGRLLREIHAIIGWWVGDFCLDFNSMRIKGAEWSADAGDLRLEANAEGCPTALDALRRVRFLLAQESEIEDANPGGEEDAR